MTMTRACRVVLSLSLAGLLLPAGMPNAEARSKDTPAAMLQRVEKLQPGKDRDELVDQLLEHGDAAWPEVRTRLENLAALRDGEDVLVDVLLGFGLTSFDELVARLPKLSDAAARRIARQLQSGHYPSDDRQLQAFTAMIQRQDDELLLLVLPDVLKRNPSAAIAKLVLLIDDKRPNLRAYAIDSLVAQHYVPSLQPMVRLLGIEQVKASADNLNLRIKLVNAIARLGKGTDAAVDPLLAAVESPDQREVALDGLALVGPPAVKAAIFLLRTADRARIETALIVLSYLRLQAAPELLPLVQGGDERTRGLATDVLAHISVPEVREEIVRMVRAKRFVDMKQGMELALTLYDGSVRQLLFDLSTDKDPGIRLMVVEQLWNLHDPDTFQHLRTIAARDADLQVRIMAAQAVACSGDPKAVDFLRKMAEVQNSIERLAIIETIARVDTMAAVPTLAHLLGDPNDAVFRTTISALQRLTYHVGPRREAEWLAWYDAEKLREPDKYEKVEPAVRKYAAEGRERAYLDVDDDDDRTIVVLSGPPFRDATHLAPHVYRLMDDFRLIVMRRGVGDGTAAMTTEAQRTVDLDKLLEKLGVDKVVLLTDAPGSHFALAYAAARPQKISHIVLHGGFWPTLPAIRRLPDEVGEAILPAWRDDTVWALRQHSLLAPQLARRTMIRGVWTALVNDTDLARRVHSDNLYDDGFTIEAAERAVAEATHFEANQAVAQVPTLVLLSAKAPWAASSLKELEALPAPVRKSVRVVKITGSKGFPLLDSPAEAVAAISEFLK